MRLDRRSIPDGKTPEGFMQAKYLPLMPMERMTCTSWSVRPPSWGCQQKISGYLSPVLADTTLRIAFTLLVRHFSMPDHENQSMGMIFLQVSLWLSLSMPKTIISCVRGYLLTRVM